MKRPEVGSFVDDGIHLTRPLRTGVDPLLEQLDVLVRELVPFRRHRHFFIEMGDDLHEITLLPVAGNESRETGVAPLDHDGALVDTEAGFVFVRAVTVKAVGFEDGTNVLLVVDRGKLVQG